MILFQNYRSAVLSVSLAALGATVPMSFQMTAQGLWLAGSAAALPGTQNPSPTQNPPGPGAGPGGGSTYGGSGPTTPPDAGGPGPSESGPTGPDTNTPDPSTPEPSTPDTSTPDTSSPETSDAGPAVPDSGGQDDAGDAGTHFGPADAPAPAPDLPSLSAPEPTPVTSRDHGGNDDDETSHFGISTMSTPATEPVKEPQSAKDEAKAFAQTLECRSACTATITKDGDMELSITSRSIADGVVQTTVTLQGLTLVIDVIVDRVAVTRYDETFDTRAAAEQQLAATAAAVKPVVALSRADLALTLKDPVTKAKLMRALEKKISGFIGVDPKYLDVLDLRFG